MSTRAEAAAATRERLLAAAWQHFATRPYEDVRLTDIAAAASVTPATLHTSFGSKEQLLSAAFLWWGEQTITQRESAPVGDAAGAVRILYDAYEAHGSAILRMLAQEERIPAIRQMTDAGRLYHHDWAARTFKPLLAGQRAPSRKQRLTAIVIATDLLVWKLLRHDMHLARDEAERIVLAMIQSPGTGQNPLTRVR